MGYKVTTVSGAEEAMLITDATSFDVVLTDALMPKMDGRELHDALQRVAPLARRRPDSKLALAG